MQTLRTTSAHTITRWHTLDAFSLSLLRYIRRTPHSYHSTTKLYARQIQAHLLPYALYLCRQERAKSLQLSLPCRGQQVKKSSFRETQPAEPEPKETRHLGDTEKGTNLLYDNTRCVISKAPSLVFWLQWWLKMTVVTIAFQKIKFWSTYSFCIDPRGCHFCFPVSKIRKRTKCI